MPDECVYIIALERPACAPTRVKIGYTRNLQRRLKAFRTTYPNAVVRISPPPANNPYPRDERRSLGDLENMRIRTADGGQVPFSLVAVVEPGRGFASIRRVDRNRAVNVTASIDPSATSAGDVIADLNARVLPEVLARYPGVFHTFEGAMAEQRDALGGLQRGFMLALLMIFALLAVPLKSYVQPLIIMSAIPFGLIGAVWGHVLLGLNVSIMSMFGLVALTGVVVNDSLIMVDFINRARSVHADVGRMARQAGGGPADRWAFETGRARARGAGGRRPPLPAHPADVADDLLRPRDADVEPEPRRVVHGADGGLARLRRVVRDADHADPGANGVHDPRRRRPDGCGGLGAALELDNDLALNINDELEQFWPRPSATMALPSFLPPGPRSTIQSAAAMTSRLCSMTTTVLPPAMSRSTMASRAVDVGGVEAGGRLVHHVRVTGPGQLGGRA